MDKDTFCENSKYNYLCPIGTQNLGLCVEKSEDCNKLLTDRNENMIPKIRGGVDDRGKDYGYEDHNLHSNCGTLVNVKSLIYENYGVVGDNIKICSWNVWGLLKYKKPFITWSLNKRINNIVDIIIKEDIDILCLQEVSTPVYKILRERIGDKYYFYEESINTEKTISERNRSLEILFLSKIRAYKYTNYLLGGILDYKNNLSVLEFPNLVIFGCYFQAGSKYSIGQEKKWFHYSRCRSEQLEILLTEIQKYRQHKMIVLGDINFHLDGQIQDWPEVNSLQKLKHYGFIDSYRSLFPNIEADPGYTEDTQTNLMRYNSKFVEKQFRYDGILSKGLHPVDCKILGTNQIRLTVDEIANMIDQFVYVENIDKIRVAKSKENPDGELALWPSDHFGILTEFT
jgi:exonuclease III